MKRNPICPFCGKEMTYDLQSTCKYAHDCYTCNCEQIKEYKKLREKVLELSNQLFVAEMALQEIKEKSLQGQEISKAEKRLSLARKKYCSFDDI